MASVETQTKAAFTRTFNKAEHKARCNLAVDDFKKKKGKGKSAAEAPDDALGELVRQFYPISVNDTHAQLTLLRLNGACKGVVQSGAMPVICVDRESRGPLQRRLTWAWREWRSHKSLRKSRKRRRICPTSSWLQRQGDSSHAKASPLRPSRPARWVAWLTGACTLCCVFCGRRVLPLSSRCAVAKRGGRALAGQEGRTGQ